MGSVTSSKKMRRALVVSALTLAVAAGFGLVATATAQTPPTLFVNRATPPGDVLAIEASAFADAKAALDSGADADVTSSVVSLAPLEITDTTVYVDDGQYSIAVVGQATPFGIASDAMLTAIWTDAADTAPDVALSFKFAGVGLDDLNDSWDSSLGAVEFGPAWVALTPVPHTLDPAKLLPGSAAASFYDEEIALDTSVNFRADVDLSANDQLNDALAFVGHDGAQLRVAGSLGSSAAAVSDAASDADEQTLALSVEVRSGGGTELPWLKERTTTVDFALAGGDPAITFSDALLVELDGEEYSFTGDLAFDAAASSVSLDLAFAPQPGQTFSAFGLDTLGLSDLELGLSQTLGDDASFAAELGAGLTLNSKPMTLGAAIETDGTSTKLSFSLDGSITAQDIVALADAFMDVGGLDASALEGFALTDVTFDVSDSPAETAVALKAGADLNGVAVDVLISVRDVAADAGTKLILGISGTGEISLANMLDADLGGIDVKVIDPNLTVAQGWGGSLTSGDLSTAESEYFQSFLGDTLPTSISLIDGLNLNAKVPLDTFGSEVTDALGIVGEDPTVKLAGTLGVELAQAQGGGAFTGMSLSAQLPTLQPDGLPTWLTLGSTGEEGEGWSLDLAYDAASSSVSVAAGGPFEVVLDGDTMTGVLQASFETGSGGTTVSFLGSLQDWAQPFGVSWLTVNDLELAATFGSGGFEGSFSGDATIAEKTFSVALEMSTGGGTNAKLKVKLEDSISFSEIAGVIGDSPDLPPDLDNLSVGPLTISVNVGSGGTEVSLVADTSVPSPSGGNPITTKLYFEAGSGNFILGMRPTADLALSQFLPSGTDLPIDPTLSDASFLISKTAVKKASTELSEPAFDFFKKIYGCDAPTAVECEGFTVDFPSGVGFGGHIKLGQKVEDAASAIWIDASDGVTLEGQLPIFGAPAPGSFKLVADLPKIIPPDEHRPDWFKSGNLTLELTDTGFAFDGGLTIRLRNSADPCPGQMLFVVGESGEKACYDVLRGQVRARISIDGAPQMTIQGDFAALDENNNPGAIWHDAFGEEWLSVKELKLQLGVEFSGTPAFTMGFLGDVIFNQTRDLRVSFSMALRVLPGIIVPELRGFTARSVAGLAMSDIVDLGEKVSGLNLAVDDLPDLSLRNLDFMFGLESNPELCISPGLRIAGDLYMNASGDAPTFANDDCKVIPDKEPEPTQRCKDNAANGCFATVRLDISPTGVLADGSLGAWAVGPISMDDAQVRLRLTPDEQSFFLKGGATIGSFASGKIEVYISKDAITFMGDTSLFGGKFQAYLEGTGNLSFTSPAFKFRAVLRADFSTEVVAVLDGSTRALKGVIIGMDAVWDIVLQSGGDPFKVISLMSQKLTELNLGINSDVAAALTKTSDVTGKISEYFPDLGLVFDMVLNGYDFGTFPGLAGTYVPSSKTCVWVVSGGNCYTIPPGCVDFGLFDVCTSGTSGYWVYPSCNGGLGTVVNGSCYTVPPFTVGKIPGICKSAWDTDGNGKCSLIEFNKAVIEPGIVTAFESATGADVPAGASLTSLLDDLAADLQGSKFAIECAEFSGSLGVFADGKKADITLATRLNLFGEIIEYGAKWDFSGVTGGNLDEAVQSIVNTLLDPQSVDCVGLPEDAPTDANATGLKLTLDDDTITENGTVKLDGEALGNFEGEKTVKIEWGDGSSETVTTASKKFSKSHQYLDDDPTATNGNTYVVKATIQDTSAKSNQATVSVANGAPAVSISLDKTTIDENGEVKVEGAFTDAGKLDTHTIRIDWADGTTSTATRSGSAGSYSFSATHRYLDDAPSLTSSDNYAISATVTDDDLGVGTDRKTLTVADTAPREVTFEPTSVLIPGPDGETDSAPLDGALTEGAIVTYAGSFKDTGTLDTHTITVDFGDGSEKVPATRVGTDGTYSFNVVHQFTDDDPTDTVKDDYAVKVAVKDDDGLQTELTETVEVSNVAPSNVTLANKGDDPDFALLQENQETTLVGSFLDPGAGDTHTVKIDWADGSAVETLTLEKGARTFDATHVYKDDNPTGTASDVYDVKVIVVDDDTGEGSGESGITVENVAPQYTRFTVADSTVNALGSRSVTKNEKSVIALSAEFEDPGTQDTYLVKIDWGEGWDETGSESRIQEIELDAGDRDFTASREYGDNGSYPVSVTLTDDDTEADSEAFMVFVNNIDPTSDIDRASTTTVQGVQTFIGDEGEVFDFDAPTTDPGSDDLTFLWDYNDGVTETNENLVSGPDKDPLLSPQVDPRAVTDGVSHTWTDACVYRMTSEAVDDDNGTSGVDRAPVVIQGLVDERWSLGFWHHQYKDKGAADVYSRPRLRCYLDIAQHMSATFNETVDASTITKAQALTDGAGPTEELRLQRALLRAWLDFANGAFDYHEQVDTDGDGVKDTVFSQVMSAAEATYNAAPAASKSQMKVQREILNAMTP